MNSTSRTVTADYLQQGFSLLETLVAFSILALSIGALIAVFSTGLRNTSITRNYNYALVLAESKLAEASMAPLSGAGAESGTDVSGYHWRIEISEMPSPDSTDTGIAGLNMYRISVSVSWENAKNQRRVELQSLRFSDG